MAVWYENIAEHTTTCCVKSQLWNLQNPWYI